jgi:hypothetical protein
MNEQKQRNQTRELAESSRRAPPPLVEKSETLAFSISSPAVRFFDFSLASAAQHETRTYDHKNWNDARLWDCGDGYESVVRTCSPIEACSGIVVVDDPFATTADEVRSIHQTTEIA